MFGASSGFVLNIGGEAGYIFGYGGQSVRLTDRFFLGEGQIRGFGIRGVGPRVLREPLLADGTIDPKRADYTDDALGGETYYRGRVEVQIPLGAAGSELGLRPSIFTDVGAVFKIPTPSTSCLAPPPPLTKTVSSFNPSVTCAPNTSGSAGFDEAFVGDSPKPRVAVGAGVSWNSPFGPLRFDLAKALVKQPGDNPKLFQFNVGTQF